MADASFIETGVDKLVRLVRKTKRISVADAAKQLGVSNVVVEEWADFLEEESIISMEYKFTRPYLVERIFTKEELAKKEKEFGGKKVAFVRKAEATLALLDREGDAFDRVRAQFDGLKKDLAKELSYVKGDLKELEKYESLKNSLVSQIAEQQKLFREKIVQIESDMLRDEKKYAEILANLGDEEKKLDKEKMMALSIRERENMMRGRLEDFKKMIKKLEANLESEDQLVVDSEEHINGLKEICGDVKASVEEKKDALDRIFAQSEKHEEEVERLQKSILEKAKAKKAEIERRIEEGKGASKKFRMFFDKKSKIDEIMGNISTERDELEKELIQLIRKAKAFSLASESKAAAPHMSEMKTTLGKIDKKKGMLEKRLSKLANLLR